MGSINFKNVNVGKIKISEEKIFVPEVIPTIWTTGTTYTSPDGYILNGLASYPVAYPVSKATYLATTGKYYWEITRTSGNNANNRIGMSSSNLGGTVNLGVTNISWGQSIESTAIFRSWTGVLNSTYTLNNGVILRIAYDADQKYIWLGYDGNWNENPISDPPTIQMPLGSDYYFTIHRTSSTVFSFSANFGQVPFAYPVPSGFSAGFGPPV